MFIKLCTEWVNLAHIRRLSYSEFDRSVVLVEFQGKVIAYRGVDAAALLQTIESIQVVPPIIKAED